MHLFVPCMRYWCRVSSIWCHGLAAASALNTPWTSFNVFRYRWLAVLISRVYHCVSLCLAKKELVYMVLMRLYIYFACIMFCVLPFL